MIDYELNVEKQCFFKERKQSDKLFLNKFTQQQKLQVKKNTLKVHSFQNYLSQQQILSQQPKQQMLKFLKQKQHQSNLQNFLNRLLITFGNCLCQLPATSTFPLMSQASYAFQQLQGNYPSQIQQKELENFQRQVLDQLDVKIKIKKDHEQNVLFPGWRVVVEGLRNVGRQFAKVEEMHQSNQEIFDMVNGKIVQDFQFIQNEIKKSLKTLDEIQRTSLQLKKEDEQYRASQRNTTQQQMDFVSLLKQQYYKFLDLELRIKQNQKNYHLQTKRLSYFRQKLDAFSRQNREKYQKIFKTRFFAIMDSYNITIQQSIKAMKKVLGTNHTFSQIQPPKVNKLEVHKNVDQQVQAQIRYQAQYFQRAKFYHRLSQQMVYAMRDLKTFMEKLQKTFSKMVASLQGFERQFRHSSQSNRSFTTVLILKFSEVMSGLNKQCHHLSEVHSKFLQSNQPYLLISQSKTLQSIQLATQLLTQLSHPTQPIQHKYKLSKLHLQQHYQSIQAQIKQIKQFYNIYITHASRLKKVIVMEFLYFLHLEKMYLNQSDFIKTSSVDNLALWHNQERREDQEDKEDMANGLEEFHVDNIYTGQYLTEQYMRVVNKFLFAAYSEWKNSQFFKQTITKEIYILLNKEQNQSLAQVIVEKVELAGYPPQILWLRQLHSESFEFLADFCMAFKSKLTIYLKTEYKLMGISVPTEVKVQVEELYCVVRMCFVPSEIGQSWFSFIGQPVAKFTVDAKIYTISINAQTIRNLFSTMLLRKLKQNTFPRRQKIMIPVSKQDPMLQLIQKRFKSGYHF